MIAIYVLDAYSKASYYNAKTMHKTRVVYYIRILYIISKIRSLTSKRINKFMYYNNYIISFFKKHQ